MLFAHTRIVRARASGVNEGNRATLDSQTRNLSNPSHSLGLAVGGESFRRRYRRWLEISIEAASNAAPRQLLESFSLMAIPDFAARSPLLLSAADSALLVVDVQEKLIPLVLNHARIVWNIGRLLRAAELLGVPACGTEQYPRGLGPTVAELAAPLQARQPGDLPSKTMFSCRGCAGVFDGFKQRGVARLVVVGIETHVCILQTALDATAAGFRVYLPVDAVGARFAIDHDTALARLAASGATLTTTEGAMFEWCETAGTPQFKEISRMVREPPP
jgi:nicotinamidase-related amidase